MPPKNDSGRTELLAEIARLKDRMKSLEASEQRFRTTLYSVDDGIIATDTSGCICEMNPKAEELTGYTRAEAIDKPLNTIYRVIDERTRHSLKMSVTEALTGKVAELKDHALLVTKDGSEIAITESAAPMFDPQGTITGLAIVFRDQTGERLNRQLTDCHLSLVGYAADHTLDEVLTFALDTVSDFTNSSIGFYTFVSDGQKRLSFQQWSSRTLKEFCEIRNSDGHYAIDKAGMWCDCVRKQIPVIHNNYASLPHKKRMPEGHPAVIRALTVPVIRGGKVVAILGVGNKSSDYTPEDVDIATYLSDVTWEVIQQKRSEAELRASEARFRQVYDRIAIGVARVSTDFLIESANTAYCEMLGYTEEELIGKHLRDITHPEIITDNLQGLSRLSRGEIDHYHKEKQFLHKSGRTVHGILNAGLVRDANGRPAYFIGSVLDITDRKHAEAALERRVLALTQPLHTAEHIDFKDIFNIERLQKLQDEFADATGVASLIIEPDGTPITRPINLRRLCKDMIRPTEKGPADCQASSLRIRGTEVTNGPVIKPCKKIGLWNAGAAISVDGKHIANWLIGHVRNTTSSEMKLREYARTLGVDEDEFMAAYNEIPTMSFEEFEKIACALYTLATYLSDIAYQNVQQARFISDLKTTREERRQFERDYQTLFRQMLDGFVVQKIILNENRQPEDYRILVVNPAFERMTGLKSSDICGSSLLKALPGIAPSWAETCDYVAMTGEPVHFEQYIRELDRHFEVTTFRPTATRLASIFNDITDRKNAETALRESEERYRTIFLNSPLGLFRSTFEGKFLAVNPALAKILGYDSTEALINAIQNIGEQIYASPEDREDVVVKNRNIENVIRRTIQYLQKDGAEELTMELYMKAVHDSEGTPLYLEGIIIDITEKRKAEEERARLHADLEAKNAELEQVVYVASHDLRSPLVNIDGYSRELAYSIEDLREALTELSCDVTQSPELTPLLDEDIPEALHFIQTSAAKMDTLLKGLLHLSRSGRTTITIETLDMDAMIRQVVDAVEFQIREAGIAIHIDPLPPCLGDEFQVNQVFSNLLNNAVKYLDPDRDGDIRIFGHVTDGRAVYGVADNGIGIAQSHQEKIFEIFHRLDPTHGDGEGLGLTIVRKIMNRLNGDIWVESEPGSGSCFYVSFPATTGKWR